MGHAHAEAVVARHAGVTAIAAARRISGSTMPAASPGARSCICICCWTCSRKRASAPSADAITVFGDNLKDLLLAAPAGPAYGARAGPRHPHGREGRRGGSARASSSPRTPSIRTSAEESVGSVAPLAARAVREARCAAHRHWQRHRLARDGQARGRADQEASRAEGSEDRRQRIGRVGVLGVRACG